MGKVRQKKNALLIVSSADRKMGLQDSCLKHTHRKFPDKCFLYPENPQIASKPGVFNPAPGGPPSSRVYL